MGVDSIVGSISDAILGAPPSFIGPISEPIIIDVLESESPEYSSEVTRDAVECGVDITDHVLEKPDSVTMDCIFTDPQLSLSGMAAAVASGFMSWKDKRDSLVRFQKAGQPVIMSLPSGFYMGYIIESISPTYTAQSGDCFRCRVTCVKINVVASSIGIVNIALLPPELAMAVAADKKAGSKKKKGPPKQEEETPADSSAGSDVGNTEDAFYV
jgi:hypothetical protein